MIKILLADDDATSLAMLRATIGKMAYEVVTARDGEDAYGILRGPEAPRIALVDWNMPKMDGLQLCSQLRREPPPHYTYIILVTSRGRREDAIAGLDAGADEFIVKPYHPDDLKAHLRVAERIVKLQGEIEDSRLNLSAVLAHIDSGVMLSNAYGKVLFTNELALTLQGTFTGGAPESRQDYFQTRCQQSPDLAMILEAVRWGNGPQGVPPDITLPGPPPRIMRWRSKTMPFPEGNGYLDVFSDITAERQLATVLTEQALMDPLTHLINRRGGEQGIGQEMARLRRGGTAHVSFAMLDIDHFKKVNDTFGHPAGDRVLRLVADKVANSVRQTDHAIRWGGEEILLVLSGADLATARVLVDRIRSDVAALYAEGLPRVTLSAGVSELNKTEDPNAAIARADAALYAAKTGGRNRVV